MNKQAMPRAQGAQSGFTLIELIVVIVILGILAATALPRFTNLSGDARAASMNAVRGALASTSATAHGTFLLNPVNPNFEGQVVAMTFGYPTANAAFMTAAGINASDYTVIGGTGTAVTAGGTTPGAPANGISIVPNSIAGTTTAATCFVTYTQSTAANMAPTISAAPTADNCR